MSVPARDRLDELTALRGKVLVALDIEAGELNEREYERLNAALTPSVNVARAARETDKWNPQTGRGLDGLHTQHRAAVVELRAALERLDGAA